MLEAYQIGQMPTFYWLKQPKWLGIYCSHSCPKIKAIASEIALKMSSNPIKQRKKKSDNVIN